MFRKHKTESLYPFNLRHLSNLNKTKIGTHVRIECFSKSTYSCIESNPISCMPSAKRLYANLWNCNWVGTTTMSISIMHIQLYRVLLLIWPIGKNTQKKVFRGLKSRQWNVKYRYLIQCTLYSYLRNALEST